MQPDEKSKSRCESYVSWVLLLLNAIIVPFLDGRVVRCLGFGSPGGGNQSFTGDGTSFNAKRFQIPILHKVRVSCSSGEPDPVWMGAPVDRS